MADKLEIDDKVESFILPLKIRPNSGAGIGHEYDLTQEETIALFEGVKKDKYNYADGKLLLTIRYAKDLIKFDTNKIKKVKDVLSPTLELMKIKAEKELKEATDSGVSDIGSAF